MYAVKYSHNAYSIDENINIFKLQLYPLDA